MEEVDAEYLTPEERAEKVWAAIQRGGMRSISYFDIVCFASQWLGMISLNHIDNDEELRKIAVAANLWLHKYHYAAPEEIHGKPDRKK